MLQSNCTMVNDPHTNVIANLDFCSCWTNPDKISSVEQLGQMESSLRESLNQIRTHKVSSCSSCGSHLKKKN